MITIIVRVEVGDWSGHELAERGKVRWRWALALVEP